VFDTTSANTGHKGAACIAIQHALDKPLFWSACRHHIGELIIGHVFTDLKIEASKSSDISVFSRFQKHFEAVPHSGEISLKTLDLDKFSEDNSALIHDWFPPDQEY